MANYQTRFSFAVAMTEAEFNWLEATHRMCSRGGQQFPSVETMNENTDGTTSAWLQESDLTTLYQMKASGETGELRLLWCDDHAIVGANEAGNIDYTVACLQVFMKRFNRDDTIEFTWAETCDRMRTGAFSGGAAAITKDGVQVYRAADMLKICNTAVTADKE